ncbi:hypothetical protein ACFSVJ_27500 [Prauserella oleivorans]
MTRPDGSEIAQRLAAGVTDAVAAVFGEEFRAGIVVEFQPQHDEYTVVGVGSCRTREKAGPHEAIADWSRVDRGTGGAHGPADARSGG